MGISFNTPYDTKTWINNWLKENGAMVERHLLDSGVEKKHKTIEKAMESLRTGKTNIAIKIPPLALTYYPETVPLDAEKEIANAMLSYSNRQKFFIYLKENDIDYVEDPEDFNIVITEKNKDVSFINPEIILPNTRFKNKGSVVLSDFKKREPVKDVSFSAYDLPHTLEYGITFENEGDVSIIKNGDNYLQALGNSMIFENDGNIQIEGLKKIYASELTFANNGFLEFPDLEVFSGSSKISSEKIYLLNDIEVGEKVKINDEVKIEIIPRSIKPMEIELELDEVVESAIKP